MTITKWLTCLLLCVVFTSAHAQNNMPFRVVPEVPYTGDTALLVYDPVKAGYSDSLQVTGFVYEYKDFKWTGYDCPLQKTDSGWVAKHVLKEGVAMLVCRFWVGDSIDRGKRIPNFIMFPNMTIVNDRKTGKPVSGAYTEYALLRRKDLRGRLSPLINPEAEVQPVVLTLWLPKEWEDMHVRRNRYVEVANGLRTAYGEKVDSILRKGAEQIAALPDVTEKDLLRLKTAYEEVFKDYKAADSMKEIILAKYPNGQAYRLDRIKDLYTSGNDSVRTARWNAFFQQFPVSQYPYADYLNDDTGSPDFFNIALTNQANMYFFHHRWAELNQLLSNCPFWMLPDFYTHFIDYALRLDEPPLSKQDLLTLAGAIMDTLQVRMKSDDIYRSGRGVYAPGEWAVLAIKENAGIFAFHAGLLYKEGRFKEALTYAEMARPYIGMENITFNNTYALLLGQLNRTPDAVAFIHKAIYAGAFTPDMLEVLQKDYKAGKGSDKGFVDYVNTFKSKEHIEKEQADIRKAITDLPVKNFRLRNMKGEVVELAKQKGKIVVIDFWATWCYYCKLAMPGMQMAVNKYADDKNVAFYFIDTMEEDSAYKKQVPAFIKKQQYTFNVLYDGPGAKAKMDEVYAGVASSLKAGGIPLKVIIDQEGRLRWANLGGSANHIAIADEVSYIIELLKKEKG